MVAKDNDGAILAAVDILRINENLDRKFHQTQSHDMFRIRIFGPSGKPRDVRDVRNLFIDWMHATPVQIIQSCAYLSLYSGDLSWNEDLMWSMETILNSIEDDALKFRVQARLDGYEEKHRVGPLTLYFTLHEIAFCDTRTIDGLCSSLARLGLHNFNNDNTAEHASVWQKLLTFLQVYNKIPVDATTLLLDQYAKCSVAGFCQHFNTLVSMKHLLLENVSEILMEGQNTER